MLEQLTCIHELNFIELEKKKLIERETELSAPVLTDLSYIPLIFEWFCELNEQLPCDMQETVVETRKEFLFIILALYCPPTLANKCRRLKKGVRQELAKLFHYKYHSSISNFIHQDIYFSYLNYTKFARNVEYFYPEIMKRLKENGIL